MKSLNKILIKCCISIFLLYVMYTPLLYIYNIGYVNSPWYYVIIMIMKYFLIICIGVFLRKKYLDILIYNKEYTKRYSLFIVAAFAIVGWMYAVGIVQKTHQFIADFTGIYNVSSNLSSEYFFLVTLYEQIFTKDMIISILLCMSIVFLFMPKEKKNYYNNKVKTK